MSKNKTEKKQQKLLKKEEKKNKKLQKKELRKTNNDIKKIKTNREKIKKNKKVSLFNLYLKQLNEQDLKKINDFFNDLNSRCLLAKADKHKMKKDFENALLYYKNNNIDIDKALDLLSLDNLGGFYARPAQSWFRLDDAAKIYPVSMEHGVMSVFRLSVNLKEKVVPELLQMALTFTIKRFPSFATTLKKGVFWHYLDSTKRCFTVKEEDDVPCQALKLSQSESQSFRALYYNNKISVEFFHALTDASGGMEFIKSLVSEYIRLTNVIIKDKTNIININDNPDISEFTNEFINVEKTPDAGGLYNKIATQMTGDLSKIKPCRILNFKMSSNKLREVARKYNITVTTYLLCIMFIACKSACEIYDGEFSIQVPVNMRKFYPSKTLRNFSMYCGIRLPISKIQDINSISNEVVEQLTSKSSKEEMHKMLYGTKKLISNIKLIPLVIKQPIAKFISGIIGDLAFTSTLSNIGIINLPEEYKDYIEDMEFVLNTSTKNRASCGLVTYNDVATLSITKLTKDPSFETRIHDLLLKDGIDITVEGSEIYDY